MRKLNAHLDIELPLYHEQLTIQQNSILFWKLFWSILKWKCSKVCKSYQLSVSILFHNFFTIFTWRRSVQNYYHYLESCFDEFKNYYAYVITQHICNKIIELNFCVGCMVSRPNRLLQCSTTMSLINKIRLTCTDMGTLKVVDSWKV